MSVAQNAVPTPTMYEPPKATIRGDGLVMFVLDSDIKLACEDQAVAQGIDFGAWLQQTVNDALRGYLGI